MRRKALKPSDTMTGAVARSFRGGLNTYDSPLNMGSQYIIEGRNIYPDTNGVLRVRFGTTRFADLSTVGDSVIAMEYYINALVVVFANGNVASVGGDGVPVLRWSSSIAAGKPGAPAGWSTGLSFTSFAQFNGRLIMCNGVDKPLIMESTMDVNYLADAGTSSNVNVPRAKYVVTHNNYLVMAVTPTNATTLYVSSKGTSGTFVGDPEPNDAINFDTSTYINRGIPEITGIGSFRDKLIICFDENIMSLNLGSYADSDAAMQVDDIVESYGAVSHKCIVPMGDDILFLDKVGISSVARALITATLSPTRESLLVSRDLQAALSRFTALQLSNNLFSIYDRIASQVLFFVPRADVVPSYETIAPTRLNPLDKSTQITLSVDDTKATLATTGTVTLVRTVAGETTGKKYFTALVGAVAGNLNIGIAQSNATATNIFTQNGTDGAVVASATGNIWIDVANSGWSFGVATLVNRLVQCAVDLDLKRIWFRLANADGSSPTNWNNNASADPSTGAGGISISGLTGALYPAVAFGAGATVGANVTFNFGNTAYTLAAPTGFTNFGVTYTVPQGYTIGEENDVYVLCVDKSQKFRAMARFDNMAYRCAARTADGRIFVGKGQTLWYYRNQYEPQFIDDGVRGSQPWSDDTYWVDSTGWIDAGTNETWSGNPIPFAISTPWSDFREPDKQKDGRYLHCIMEGAGNVTIEQYNDRFTEAQLSMTFTMTQVPAGPDITMRPLNNDQLYAWNSKFTRARLRVHGDTQQQLALLSLGLLYLPGGYRR